LKAWRALFLIAGIGAEQDHEDNVFSSMEQIEAVSDTLLPLLPVSLE
jgi:hypothetical protein